MKTRLEKTLLLTSLLPFVIFSCGPKTEEKAVESTETSKFLNPPLISDLFTADPSAHVFDGRIYIYPSHDIEAGVAFNDNGDHFAMQDYHVLSLDHPQAQAVDHGVALHIDDVPWAERQMWAPDAACKDGRYYFYFPAKKADGRFQLGVATGNNPAGPFTAQPQPIQGSYSIDPAVFADDDGSYYLYFGGIWGGQLQQYRNNQYSAQYAEPDAGLCRAGAHDGRRADDGGGHLFARQAGGEAA